MDELLDQFLIEGRELVQQASEDVLALDRDPSDAARLDSVFRAIHTLKGSVGLFDLAPMGQALHAAEDLLSAIRGGRLAITGALTSLLLDTIGATEQWLGEIGQTGSLSRGAAQRGQALQDALCAPLAGSQPASASEPIQGAAPDWVAPLLARTPELAGQALTAMRYIPRPDAFLGGDDPLDLIRAIPGLAALDVLPREPWGAAQIEPFTCNLVISVLSQAPLDDVRRVMRFVMDQVVLVAVAPVTGPAPGPAARGLRVDAGKVDALVDLVGELIVAKNALAHLAAQVAAADVQLGRALAANQADIERLVGDTHRAVMGLRMVPLAQTFRRLPRLVRDLAGRMGKDIQFDIAGDELEADKSVVDGLYEPLLHGLRNAVDHGIENPAERAASGKPSPAQIRLSAGRDGNQIVISLIDDGRGIDPVQIRAVAQARGIRTAAALAAMDDQAVAELIFEPGFSTAATITDVSGRGVGMDAVRSAVSALGGRVALSTRLGLGTTIRLTLPQTATVHKILIVELGGERFGIPLSAVAEMARVPLDQIHQAASGEAFVLRGQTVPVLRLASLLGQPVVPRLPGAATLLVAETADGPVGLEVDGVATRVDVLLRPLTGLLAGMPGMLGAALLGDGSILMVLDLMELIG
jgi:two-component system chemotaxis sensor kinase CheA